MSSSDDSKKPKKLLSQGKSKSTGILYKFVLERTESWTNRKATSFAMIVSQAYLLPWVQPNVTVKLNIVWRTAPCIIYSICRSQLHSGEKIDLRQYHSKTGSFSICSRFCPVKYKIYIEYTGTFTFYMAKKCISFLLMFHTGYLPFTLLPTRAHATVYWPSSRQFWNKSRIKSSAHMKCIGVNFGHLEALRGAPPKKSISIIILLNFIVYLLVSISCTWIMMYACMRPVDIRYRRSAMDTKWFKFKFSTWIVIFCPGGGRGWFLHPGISDTRTHAHPPTAILRTTV
jgi:hypothetical protein